MERSVFLNKTRNILKKISDVVTLETFSYRDQSFIKKDGDGDFFHGRRDTEPDPPPEHTHKARKKI